jgi:D-ribulokinase
MYLGIDFGTSGVRSLALDSTQTIIAETKTSYDIRDSHAWKLALETVITQIPVDIRKRLKAIAIDGTSSTVLMCDPSGEPMHEPLLYNDRRGSEVLVDLRAIAARSGIEENITLSSTSSLAKLLWLVKNLDFGLNFKFEDRYFLHQADWIGFLLHGHLGISDYHNALKLGYDPQNLEYPKWLRELEISKLFPQVLPAGKAIAPIKTELAKKYQVNPECLICAGTTDSTAAFIASGAHKVGEAVTSLGSTLVLKILSPKPIENLDRGVYSHRFGDLWLAGGASNSGGAVLKQFFTDLELESLSAEIAKDKNLTTNLNYYPLLQIGERFPINDPKMLPRIEPRPVCDREFLYALLDGIARIEAEGYYLLQKLGAIPPTRIYTTGGGAKNSLWTAIRQKYLKAEIVLSIQTEAAYGTAILAMQGYRDSNQKHNDI